MSSISTSWNSHRQYNNLITANLKLLLYYITILKYKIVNSIVKKPLVKLRIIGSVLVITSYFTILHIDTTTGVILNIIAESISMPFFIYNKIWDVVLMLSFMISIGLSKLLSLFLPL